MCSRDGSATPWQRNAPSFLKFSSLALSSTCEPTELRDEQQSSAAGQAQAPHAHRHGDARRPRSTPAQLAASHPAPTSSGTRMYLIVLPRTYASGIRQNRSPSCAQGAATRSNPLSFLSLAGGGEQCSCTPCKSAKAQEVLAPLPLP